LASGIVAPSYGHYSGSSRTLGELVARPSVRRRKQAGRRHCDGGVRRPRSLKQRSWESKSGSFGKWLLILASTQLSRAWAKLKSMNQPTQLWTMLIAPVATLLGTMLVVMLGVYLQNRSLERAVDLMRAEFKQQLAELELRLTRLILDLTHRVERLKEARGLIRTP
jgi:hypothetical protein